MSSPDRPLLVAIVGTRVGSPEGCGRTSITAGLAKALVERGRRVMVADGDAAGHASTLLRIGGARHSPVPPTLSAEAGPVVRSLADCWAGGVGRMTFSTSNAGWCGTCSGSRSQAAYRLLPLIRSSKDEISLSAFAMARNEVAILTKM
ncbi:ParA family protein [Streptomyces sp. NPDC127117]|uniref:ParA family protein n=1 Tax=Streptomyces sp. NPDC127117 TaxID=3345368 RepID=UPI003630A4CA